MVRALLVAFLLGAGCASAQQPCLLKAGDPLEAVKRQFGIHAEPTRQARTTPGGTAWQYHLPDPAPKHQVKDLNAARSVAKGKGQRAAG